MRRPWRRKPATGRRPATAEGIDSRIWGRHYAGPPPWLLGLAVLLLAAAGIYLAFTKQIPFTGEGYRLNATFENALLRSSAPVRIAGVDVGEVVSVEARGEGTEVTFTVDPQGRPVHSDATIEVRPRLFLEGNFFLDLEPGSPSAPELADGDTIPITQTSTAVQLGEVMTALQAPSRRSLQETLDGFGTALTYEPTAEDDADQEPESRGRTAAEALNQALRDGGPAGRDTAIVNEALRGRNPGDLAGMIAAQRRVFAQLHARERELQGLITSFNVTTGALAAESASLREVFPQLASTAERARPALRELSEALPPLRRFAIELEPSVRELPGTIEAAGPWLDQARPLLGRRELGGLARRLRRATPGLARTAASSRRLFRESRLLGLCVSNVLIPTGDIVIDDAGGAYPFGSGAPGYPVGIPSYREFFYALVNQAGEAQGFDGNGSFLRVNAGGGDVFSSTPYPQGGFRNDTLYANMPAAGLGTRPVLNANRPKPPFRMDVPCHTNPLPDINGPAAAVGPPSPEVVP